MNNRDRGGFTRHILMTSLSQGMVLACAVAASVMTARALGPAGKGQLALALLIPHLTTALGRFGIGHAIVFYSPRTEDGKLLLNSIVLSTLISLALIVTTTTAIYLFQRTVFAELSNALLFIAILAIPIYMCNYIVSSVFQGRYNIPLWNRLTVAGGVINVVLLFVVFYLLHSAVKGALIASIAAMSAVVILSLSFLMRPATLRDAELDWALIRKLLRFGSKSHIGNILKDLSYRGDILIVSYFLPPASVGHYVVAVALAETIWKLPDAIGSVLLPKVAAMTTEAARAFTPRACRLTVIPLVLICLTIFMLSRPIVTGFFGSEYDPSVSSLRLLLPGVLAFSIWKVLASDLIGQGHPGLYSVTSGVALATMLVADMLLVPALGIDGASIGSSLSYIAGAVIIVSLYSRTTGNSVHSIVVPRREDLSTYREMSKALFRFLAKYTANRK